MLTRQIEAFSATPADRLPQGFRELVDTLWSGGGEAVGAVAPLTAALAAAPERRQSYLVIALGLLADAEDPDVMVVLRERLEEYLALVPGAGRPLLRALLYLLGHFPDDRQRVLAALENTGPSPDEASRLDRSLATFDAGSPVIGSVWPSPLAWSLSGEESAGLLEWARSLPAGVVAGAWQNDTRTLHAYSGAKALWSAEHGLGPDREEPEVVVVALPRAPGGTGPARARFADALRCPSCRSALADSADANDNAGKVSCTGCGAAYSEVDGCLDVRSGVEPGEAPMAEAAATRYERTLRPAVLRLSGSNWDSVATPADEDAHLLGHVRPVKGPLLDLGCGPGRWTATLAAAFGQERIIALDSSRTMLRLAGDALPDVTRVAGDALNLPFADASLGAVSCWNAIQALPDPAKAVAEVGRCLRPGGTFTVLTFRTSSDSVYAHFQKRLTVKTFRSDEVDAWLGAAGMTVQARSTPGTFLVLTAVRDRD